MPPAATRWPSGWNATPSSVQPSAASIRIRSGFFVSQFQIHTRPSAGLVWARNFESAENVAEPIGGLVASSDAGQDAAGRVPQLREVIRPADGEPLSVRAGRDGVRGAEVGRRDFLAGGRIPDADRGAGRARQAQGIAGDHRDRVSALVVRPGEELAVANVPDVDDAVSAGAGELRPVRAERQMANLVAVAAQYRAATGAAPDRSTGGCRSPNPRRRGTCRPGCMPACGPGRRGC